MNKKVFDHATKLNQLAAIINNCNLVPGSGFFAYLKKVTKSPASNACWIKSGNFAFHIVVDGLLSKDGWEDGCSISYGHLDRDRGSFHLLNTAGMLKFDLRKELQDSDEDAEYYGEDDIPAIEALISELISYETRYQCQQGV